MTLAVEHALLAVERRGILTAFRAAFRRSRRISVRDYR
jgi:hypothetical protein